MMRKMGRYLLSIPVSAVLSMTAAAPALCQVSSLPADTVMASPSGGGFLSPRALSNFTMQGGDLNGSVNSPSINSLAVTNAKMAVGSAGANIGTLGGVLGGTLPNPTMTAGAAATNVGTLGGDLSGSTLPNPTISALAVTNAKMAAGAATANIGALGGILTGTLPNPTAPALPGLSTTVSFPSSFSGSPSFGLALPSAANPWVVAATSTSPATDSPGGVLYVALTESQALKSVAISNASPAVVTLAAHGITAGKAVAFLGTLGTPLVASKVYYVCVAGLTTNTFEIGTAGTGSDCTGIVNTTGASSGVTMATNQGLPGTSPSIYGFTTVTQGSIGNYNGALGYIYNGNTMASQPLGVASAIGNQGVAVCGVAACSATWAALAAYYDTTGTANPANPQYGMEIDVYAVGTDSANNRLGLQIVAATPTGVGTPPTVGNAVLIGGPGQYGNILNMGPSSRSVNGINLAAATFTGSPFISTGFSVDNIGDVFGLNIEMPVNNGLIWGTNTGTNGGQELMLSGASGWFFDNRGSGDWVFRVGSGLTEEFRISAAGVLSSAGTAGATCPAGVTAATVTVKGGIVTHC